MMKSLMLSRCFGAFCSSITFQQPSQSALAAAALADKGPQLASTAQQLLQSVLGLQQLHVSAHAATVAILSQPPRHYVQLDRLRPAEGSTKLAKRWGRGNGGDRGTYCGRGVKGQKARKGNKPHLLFDGGQNQIYKYPKVWIKPSSPVLYKQVGLSKVLHWIKLGLLDSQQVITMKDLRDSGCVSKTIRWGVELVANGYERIGTPLHLEVSSASPEAKALVEAAGGSVTRVYYTRLGLQALLKPENFEKQGYTLPRPVRAWPPHQNGKFDMIGLLPPVTQLPSGTVQLLQ
eukprot:GHRR01015423.1.p1 GENE.GHRR01015423.1~~GHRR01015423.1.p1  ORF type:complete len:290 (+),score=78.45 GHRR01015423.1:373-1242(+)